MGARLALREPLREMLGDALRGMSIPELRDPTALAAGVQDFVDELENAHTIAADQRVCAFLDGDRTLGVLPHRETRHAKRCCFLLHAARIREHERGGGHEAK